MCVCVCMKKIYSFSAPEDLKFLYLLLVFQKFYNVMSLSQVSLHFSRNSTVPFNLKIAFSYGIVS